jgi:hypothetical protein
MSRTKEQKVVDKCIVAGYGILLVVWGIHALMQ